MSCLEFNSPMLLHTNMKWKEYELEGNSRVNRLVYKEKLASCSYCHWNSNENHKKNTYTSLKSRLFDKLKNGIKIKSYTVNKSGDFDWWLKDIKKKRVRP